VIPQREGKVEWKGAVASLEIFLHAIYYLETPRGRYSEEERTKPVVLKRDRSKSNIILTTPQPSAQQQQLLPTAIRVYLWWPRASTTPPLSCHRDRSNYFFPCQARATEHLNLLHSCFASTRTDTPLNTCGHGSDCYTQRAGDTPRHAISMTSRTQSED